MIPLLLAAALASPPAATPAASPDPVEEPAVVVEPLSDEVRAAMIGVTWREDCPVGLDALRLVTVPYVDEQGVERRGQVVVHEDHAEAVGRVFATLHTHRFAIHRVEPAHLHEGNDDLLMQRNITSAFNCRPVAGGTRYSEHSHGHALDLNPLWNPYVKGDRVLPPEGRAYLPRDPARPGTIVAGDRVVAAFQGIGWSWGGTWSSLKDYQHFSATGR